MNRQQRRRADRQARKAPRQHSASIGIGANTADANCEMETAARFHQAGELDRAAHIYRRILEQHPDHPRTLHLLGMAEHQMGRDDAAIELIGRAVAVKPDFTEALNNLGAALKIQGRLDEAITYLRRAIAIDPGYAPAHNSLGTALNDQGKHDEAVACHQRAVEINPNDAGAHNNLGVAWQSRGEHGEAQGCFRRAIAIEAGYAEAYNNLGVALRFTGDLEESLAYLRRALDLDPSSAKAHNNLGATLQNLGKLDEASEAYRTALSYAPDFVEARSCLVSSMNYSARITPEEIFAESRRWDAVHAAPLAARARPHANDPGPERRLRVGYVSPDFRTHSVNYFFEPLLAAHDRQAVEVFCYAEVARPDDTTARLRELADGWCPTIGMTNAEVADRIRKDRIDILVDLAGHTAHNRLLAFAERPAPVQVSWLGYPNTTGMTAIDYRLTDARADPQGDADALHSETLVRLPDCFLCYAPPPDAPETAPSPSAASGHITFGSFNNLAKIRPGTIAVWARILEQLPGARLMIKSKPLADEGTRKRYLELFAAQGIGAERLDLVAWIPSQSGHLGAYGRIDIALDTFPYNGTTTTCEALWMGVPVIALRGNRHAARVGLSLLSAIGLPELAAPTKQAYVETAVALAGDRDRLTALRRDLRGRLRAAPLCDAQGFARNLETAYRDMWRRWCRDAHAESLEERREAVGE